MRLTAPAVGGGVLVCVYSVQSWDVRLLLLLFGLSFLLSLILLFIPIPMPKGKSRIRVMLQKFLVGRKDVIRDKKTLFLVLHSDEF